MAMPDLRQDKVAVVIPAHNRAEYLGRSIESVLAQTHTDWELFVVDDHSTDGTLEIARGYVRTCARVHVLRVTSGRGAQAARNTGIWATPVEAAYIAFLDSDDRWEPRFLERCMQRAQETGAAVVYTEGRIVFADGREAARTGVARLEGMAYPALLTRPPGPIFSNILVRRDCFAAIGYLDDAIIAFQEWDTCLRLAEKFPFAFVGEPLFVWYRHAADTISGNPQRNADGYSQVVEKHRAQILRLVGRQALVAHYSKLAQLNRANGRRGREFACWANTLRAGVVDVASALRLFSHVLTHVTGLSDEPLNKDIRVYG
jgi:glycosyltransferase involved in cell wall biosynthesis